MKNIITAALIFIGIVSCGKNEQNVAEKKIWVRGNCGMCKERIEEHVSKINGVKKAVWDVKSKELTVRYDSTVTNNDAIETICANIGHATKSRTSDGKITDELPECCRPHSKAH